MRSGKPPGAGGTACAYAPGQQLGHSPEYEPEYALEYAPEYELEYAPEHALGILKGGFTRRKNPQAHSGPRKSSMPPITYRQAGCPTIQWVYC